MDSMTSLLAIASLALMQHMHHTRANNGRSPMKALTAALVAALTLAGTALAHTADRADRMTYQQLANAADQAIRHGAIRSHRWGDASPYLIRLCYEMVQRAFAPYGTQDWAAFVVRRESGCNPGAINSSSQTTGIAQIHPAYHRWINYSRVQRDMRYALWTFVRLSRGGRNTGPWCLC